VARHHIYVDDSALAEEGVSLDRPITMQLDQIALKSALKLLLDKVSLTYVVEDDVLKSRASSTARAAGDESLSGGRSGHSDRERHADRKREVFRAADRPLQQPAPAAPYTGPGSLGNGQSVGSAAAARRPRAAQRRASPSRMRPIRFRISSSL